MNEHFPHNKIKTFNLLLQNITFVLFGLLILHYTNILYTELFLNPATLFYLILILLTIQLLILKHKKFLLILNKIYKNIKKFILKSYNFWKISNKKNQKKHLEPYLKFFFIFCFFIIILANIEIRDFEDLSIINITADVQYWLLRMVFILGVLLLYFNSESIQQESEDAEKEIEKEEEKEEEFGKKFERINKIPILKNIVKIFYKEGWFYSFGLIAILAIASFLFFYNVDHEFREDEYQVQGAATSYYRTGELYTWNWIEDKQSDRYYDRAWPHTILIAQSYKIFGISEISSRLVSIIFGLIFLATSYFVSKSFFKDKKFALLIPFIFAFYPSFINIFRYTRMYALLIPIFLLLFYFFYRFITEKNTIDFRIKKLNDFLNKNLNFGYKYLPFVLILLYFNYHIHINSLIVLPVLFLFVIYLAITKKENRYIITSVIGVMTSLIIFLVYYLGLTTKFLWALSFFERENHIYLEYLTQYPFIYEVGTTLLYVGLALLFILKKRRDLLVYLYLTIIVSALFFIYIADRYAGFLYISHIAPLSIVLMIYILLKCFKNKTLIYFLISIAIILNFYNAFPWLYEQDTTYGQFTKAYPTIKENFNTKNQVLFAQYSRGYYLREMDDTIKVIDMENYKTYEFKTFKKDLEAYESGWITWETRKGYHLEEEIRNYIEKNFKKYHGEGIDQSNVEVYYFNKNMIK